MTNRSSFFVHLDEQKTLTKNNVFGAYGIVLWVPVLEDNGGTQLMMGSYFLRVMVGHELRIQGKLHDPPSPLALEF